MKWLCAILLLLSACTVSRKTPVTVILDSSASYITGGNGKGYFVAWDWKQIEGEKAIIDNPRVAITKTYVSSGYYGWQMKITDNLGQQKIDTIYLEIK
jgi:predicted secreted protein